jgi:hypothetical protein
MNESSSIRSARKTSTGAGVGLHLRRGARLVALATAVVLAPLAGADGKGQARPLHGACVTAFEQTGPTSARFEGQCHFSHLGLTQVAAEQNLTFLPNGTVIIVTENVYAAANGDMLFASSTIVGVFTSSTTIEFSGTEFYDGGTGRFDGAFGSVSLTGGAAFTSASGGVGHYAGAGTVSY